MTLNFLIQSSTLSRYYYCPANDRFSVPVPAYLSHLNDTRARLGPLGTRVHVICAKLKRRLAPPLTYTPTLPEPLSTSQHRADFPFTHYRRENIPFYCPLVLFKEKEETPWKVSHDDLPNPCYGGPERWMVICHSNVSIFAVRFHPTEWHVISPCHSLLQTIQTL